MYALLSTALSLFSTILFINFAPKLPPIISIIGLGVWILCRLITMFLSPLNISCRIGDPVYIAFLLYLFTVSLNEQSNAFDFFAIKSFGKISVELFGVVGVAFGYNYHIL